MNKQVKWAASPYLLWMAIFIIVPLALIAVFALDIFFLSKVREVFGYYVFKCILCLFLFLL